MIEMDEGARLWTIKFAARNYWRVASWYELDDLIQDGFMQWYRVAQKYPHVRTRPHLMRLYQLTFMCWITDLANKRTRQPKEILTDEMAWDQYLPAQQETATIKLLIEQAPAAVRAVVSLLSTEDGRRRLMKPYRVRNAGRETLNDRLCRLVGVDSSTDLVGQVRSYFSPA